MDVYGVRVCCGVVDLPDLGVADVRVLGDLVSPETPIGVAVVGDNPQQCLDGALDLVAVGVEADACLLDERQPSRQALAR